jgi:hypothetical protein
LAFYVTGGTYYLSQDHAILETFEAVGLELASYWGKYKTLHTGDGGMGRVEDSRSKSDGDDGVTSSDWMVSIKM